MVEVIHAFGHRGCKGGFARARNARDCDEKTGRGRSRLQLFYVQALDLLEQGT